jgi:hypothetical protein
VRPPAQVYYFIGHTLHTYIPLTLYPRRGSRGITDISPRLTKIRDEFYHNYLAMRNTADVTRVTHRRLIKVYRSVSAT